VPLWSAPVTVGSGAFFILILVLVVAAWGLPRTWFLPVLIAINLAMLASWLGIAEAGALLIFLVPGYVVAKLQWGRGASRWKILIPLAIAATVAMFLVLRRYPGFDLFASSGQPLSVIGISYIMFRQIHVLVDAPYSAEPFTAARYFGYTTAIWTLVAGPIQRYPDFVAGLGLLGRPDERVCLASAHRITWGILKAFLLAPIFLEGSKLPALGDGDFNWLRWLLAFYGYFIFLYLDFSGYTDIVIGSARLCGFDTIPENFDRPYLSRNVQEFWTRWHMSLGSWFRDYFFTPLFRALGEITRWHSLLLVNVIALFLTFLTVGAWHGPGLNFVVFGLTQALGVTAAVVLRTARETFLGALLAERYEANPIISRIATLLCFHYVCASFLFLENSVGDVGRYFGSMYRALLSG
jgi:D-alanyl-lipoteichoic acid acyltransferase DltB (MBOAT superfamily)